MKSFIQKYGGFLFVLIGIIGIFYFESQRSVSAIEVSTTESVDELALTSSGSTFYVDIKGAVLHPGVYVSNSESRVIDVIVLAGGTLENADTRNVNFSEAIYDGMMITIPTYDETDEEEDVYYYVDIKGAVVHPDVYQVLPSSRISDVIELAGGLLDDADVLLINRTDIVTDGMEIIIPFEEESMMSVSISGAIENPGTYLIETGSVIQDLIELAGGMTEEADASSVIMNQVLTSNQSVTISTLSVSLDNEESGLININTGDLDDLMTLNGIGIILGQRIIDYRAEYGFFESIEDIMNVSGIKESIYGQIKDDITV